MKIRGREEAVGKWKALVGGCSAVSGAGCKGEKMRD